MRSLTARFFVGLVLVSLAALALGTWWVQRTVAQQFGRQLVVEQTREVVDGQVVEREVRRELPGNGPVVTEDVRGVDVALLNRRLLIAFSVVVIGAALVTALMARQVLGPVHALRLAVDQMASGTSTARVAVTGNDELTALGRAFNSMADALAQQEQLKRDLTNDIAHELRTPLTDLRGGTPGQAGGAEGRRVTSRASLLRPAADAFRWTARRAEAQCSPSLCPPSQLLHKLRV